LTSRAKTLTNLTTINAEIKNQFSQKALKKGSHATTSMAVFCPSFDKRARLFKTFDRWPNDVFMIFKYAHAWLLPLLRFTVKIQARQRDLAYAIVNIESLQNKQHAEHNKK
jgi:hypothetical protein